MTKGKITNPSELRSVLLQTMEGVIEGKVGTSQANTVVGISQEIHKSLKQEWEMRCYAAENLVIQNGRIVHVMLDDKSNG